MPMLLFMPWCRIDKAYQVGCISIVPFERHEPIVALDEARQCHVNTIMGAYRTIEGTPVDRAALVRYGDKSPIDDLTEDEIENVYELVAMACFCGLAKREYFTPGLYCNSDCFALYAQGFGRPGYTAIRTRRREGATSSLWRVDKLVLTIPTHCRDLRAVRLDPAFLEALVAHRAQSVPPEWARWQNAISCFNQANTDSENVSYQTEWVLLCSAFERLLDAKTDYQEVARKFSEAMRPSASVSACMAARRSDRWADCTVPLRQEWMREFYRIRGDFAHGKLNTGQPSVWKPLEHLVLGTIAFSLVVKCLLRDAGRYELTIDDRAQIDSFEAFADTNDFLEPPCDQGSSLDSHWRRLCSVRESKLPVKDALKKAWEELRATEVASDGGNVGSGGGSAAKRKV